MPESFRHYVTSIKLLKLKLLKYFITPASHTSRQVAAGCDLAPTLGSVQGTQAIKHFEHVQRGSQNELKIIAHTRARVSK